MSSDAYVRSFPKRGRSRVAHAISLVLLSALGCGPIAAPRDEPPRSADAARTFEIKGVVRGVDREGGYVTIRHEAIEGFMDAMTMSLPVVSKDELNDLNVGDEVEGTFQVGGGGPSRLTRIVVSRPAPLELAVENGKVELRPKTPILSAGEAVPDFEMTTQTGDSLRLSDLKGMIVVLTFVYTRCPVPDFCPLMDKKFRELDGLIAANRKREGKVRLISVSFDPEHDTPEVLAQHAERVGAKPPGWIFAVASHDELRKVAPSLGLGYGPGRDEIMHNLRTAMIDAEGKLVRIENGNSWSPVEVFKLIQTQLREEGR